MKLNWVGLFCVTLIGFMISTAFVIITGSPAIGMLSAFTVGFAGANLCFRV